MAYPVFDIPKISLTHIYRKLPPSGEMAVSLYEFEFYAEDWEGGTLTDGVFRPARKGQFCLFKPGQKQRLIPPYRCYVMNVRTQDPDLCKQLDEMPICSPLWHSEEVISLLSRMLAQEDRNSLESQLKNQSRAARILSLVLANDRIPGSKNPRVLRHQADLQETDQYIRTHLNEPLSMEQLAGRCNLNPTYFQKLFSAAYGMTPAQRVQEHRITAVKTGLMDSSLSLEELAERCGFSSASYMGYRFRQTTGMTLSQFRSSLWQDPER